MLIDILVNISINLPFAVFVQRDLAAVGAGELGVGVLHQGGAAGLHGHLGPVRARQRHRGQGLGGRHQHPASLGRRHPQVS